MQLEGKVALITGGGTGIGAGVAKRFVEEGAKICITGRRREKLDEIAASLPGDSVTVVTGSCCAEDDAQKMVEAALGIKGRIDILVNNAAIERNKSVVDMDPAVWREMLENNLTGPFLMMKAVLPEDDRSGRWLDNQRGLSGRGACRSRRPRVLRHQGRGHPSDQAGGL